VLQDALSYPLEGDQRVSRYLIASVLVLGSIFIIPAFFIAGYWMRTMKHIAQGNKQPPKFDEWGSMFIDGVKVVCIYLTYLLIPLITFGAILSIGGVSQTEADIISIVLVLTIFVAYYIFPFAIAHVAVTEDVMSAFDGSSLVEGLTSLDYLIATLVHFIGTIALQIALMFILLITFGIGTILLLPFSYFIVLFGAFIYGSAYQKIMLNGEETA